MPLAAKAAGVNLLTVVGDWLPASTTALLMGAAHHVTISVAAAAATIDARPMSPSFTPIQRYRLTL